MSEDTVNFHGKIWINILHESRPSDWSCWQASPETRLHLKDRGYNYCHHRLHQELQPHEFGASSLLVSALKLPLSYARPVVFLTYFWTVRNWLFLYLEFPINHDNTINRGLGGTGKRYLALHSYPDYITQRGAAFDVVLTGVMESHLIENADWCYKIQKGMKITSGYVLSDGLWRRRNSHKPEPVTGARYLRPLPLPSPSLSCLTAEMFSNWTVSKAYLVVTVKSYNSSGEHLYLFRQ